MPPDTATPTTPILTNRLFIGIQTCAMVFADRLVEVDHDYKRLGSIPFETLVLELEPDCPPELKERIERIAEEMKRKKGQRLEIDSCGHSIELGRKTN